MAITKCTCVHGLTPSPAPKQVQNVGEEGFGYLSWIVERWESLPPCALMQPCMRIGARMMAHQ